MYTNTSSVYINEILVSPIYTEILSTSLINA